MKMPDRQIDSVYSRQTDRKAARAIDESENSSHSLTQTKDIQSEQQTVRETEGNSQSVRQKTDSENN